MTGDDTSASEHGADADTSAVDCGTHAAAELAWSDHSEHHDEPATTAASGSDDTTAAPTGQPTEMFETNVAPTPELAWSADTEDQETETTNEKRRLWLVPVMALLVAAIAVASALLFYTHRAPAASTRVPAAPPLDGTYRLDHNFSKATANGAPAPHPPNTNNTSWWAFRSSCTSTGCVATSTKLDKDNHQVAQTPAVTAQFHFAGGHWQAVPFQSRVQQHLCLGANGEVVAAGENRMLVTLSMDSQPDGTLRGVQTDTVLTNECGSQGQVASAPFVASRTGDLPPGVVVADPGTVTAFPATNTPFPSIAGQALDGIFRVDFDYAKQTVNGDTVTNPPPNDSIWWAFRSACSITGCVATGVALASENPSKQGGMVLATDVLSFADGHWQDTASLRPWTNCPGATNGTTADNEATVSWSWETKPGGTLQGIQTVTVLTNECGHQGMVYRTPVSATRVGDVPPTVVLADPALFTAPPAPATNAHR